MQIIERLEMEKARVGSTMRELFIALCTTDDAPLKNKVGSFPYTHESRSFSDSTLEQRCFVAGGRKVYEICKRGGNWLSEGIVELNSYCTGMNLFNLEGVLYLTAGHKEGIEVVNLKERGEQKSVVIPRGCGGAGFRDITLVKSSNSGLADESLLVASCSGFGVVHVPLLDFCQDNKVMATDSLQKYLILKDSGKGSDHFRLREKNGILYIAKGSDLYSIDYNSSRKMDGAREMIKVQSIDTHSFITAIDVDIHGRLYLGTNTGKIFRDKEVFFIAPNHISHLQAGSFKGEEGIYYNGLITHSCTAVYFTDGKDAEIISPGGILTPVIDFFISLDCSFFLEKNKIIMVEGRKIAGSVSLEPLKRGRYCLSVYGGMQHE